MSFSNSKGTFPFLLLTTFALILQISFGAEPLFFSCTGSKNFTTGSPYDSNLRNLISFLNYKTPLTGFGQRSLGNYSQQTYGLSLCRDDASTLDCKTCISDASSEALKRCPYNKGATIWYDNCMFKYLDKDFLGHIDNTSGSFFMWNLQNVSDPMTFNYITKEFLSLLAYEASVNPKLYASGDIKLLGDSNRVYGLTQCTRDLSGIDCKKCLVDAIGQLPNCCDGKEGGRVIGGSCNFRYEIYPFVKE